MKTIIIISLLQITCFSQEIMSQRNYVPCYSYKHINLPAELQLVEVALAKKLKVTKKVQIVFTEAEMLYFYNKFLFRIEIKNKKLNCPFDEDGFYIDNDIIVYYDDYFKKTSITSKSIWQNLVKEK